MIVGDYRLLAIEKEPNSFKAEIFDEGRRKIYASKESYDSEQDALTHAFNIVSSVMFNGGTWK